jgi:hypothetical protein
LILIPCFFLNRIVPDEKEDEEEKEIEPPKNDKDKEERHRHKSRDEKKRKSSPEVTKERSSHKQYVEFISKTNRFFNIIIYLVQKNIDMNIVMMKMNHVIDDAVNDHHEIK